MTESELERLRDPKLPHGLSEKLVLFRVADKATGELLTVDQRTYDPELHDLLEAP